MYTEVKGELTSEFNDGKGEKHPIEYYDRVKHEASEDINMNDEGSEKQKKQEPDEGVLEGKRHEKRIGEQVGESFPRDLENFKVGCMVQEYHWIEVVNS